VRYAEACRLVGFVTLPLLERESREDLIDLVGWASNRVTAAVPPENAKRLRDEFEPTLMTYAEACALLGFHQPPDLEPDSRRLVLRFVKEQTENGKRAIDPRLANMYRQEIEEFG
jgi:hypothetical protein